MPRRLSSASLSKYLIGGVYYDFIQYVKADKELAFEIRVKDEVQQQYKAEHSSFDGDYLAIDMEWAPDQAAIPVEYRLKDKTKVDLLVISNKPNEEGKHDIYLAEVKCGLGAVEGKSGIEDHVRMSQAIINNEYVRQMTQPLNPSRCKRDR